MAWTFTCRVYCAIQDSNINALSCVQSVCAFYLDSSLAFDVDIRHVFSVERIILMEMANLRGNQAPAAKFLRVRGTAVYHNSTLVVIGYLHD